MKNPTIAQLSLALELHEANTPMKAILAETGLNYSQAWYFIRSAELRATDKLETGEITPQVISDLRSAGHSWGEVAVRCQLPESRIRKMFSEATGLKSQGQRIGKGGRFYYGPISGQPLYADTLKPTGTSIPVGAHLAEAVECAQEQRMIHWDIKEIRSLAQEMGLNTKGTKAQLVRRIKAAPA